MTRRKTAYELSASQIETPHNIIRLFWKLIRRHRDQLGTVLDMGAGDGRLARGGIFRRYVGVEIDKSRIKEKRSPNRRVLHNCAFRHRDSGYDACIGNPPYVRHHDVESPWKEETLSRMEGRMKVTFNKTCNLYIYFLSLGLLKTHAEGLLALLIPFEWVSRPSAKAVRNYIRDNRWDVHVYRFKRPIFDGVLTTASVSIVDKRSQHGTWSFYDVDDGGNVKSRNGAADCKSGVLSYEDRGELWAMRGLSPGSQKLFALTEGERIRCRLTKRDVVPCVTTLKTLPRELSILSTITFNKYLRNSGERCWLIKSFASKRSKALNAYLDSVLPADRDTYTCRNQHPWFKFRTHPIPKLLISSGFTKFGPKLLINSIGATALGGVFGIHGKLPGSVRRLRNDLLTVNFERQVVPHAAELKKVEVKQFNAALNKLSRKCKPYGKGSSKG
jgi:hypothetical protein